jgi:predicted nicotinamide N-methyase
MAGYLRTVEAGYVEELVPLGDEPLRIRRPRDLDELLTEQAFVNEELLPYWAELWVSGVALAWEMSVRSLKGRRTLELGCGLALPSIAAARAGARATATDWSPSAIELVRANADLNGVEVQAEVQSWREPEALVERAPWPLVLASDVVYETGNVEVMLDLLPRLVDERSEIWVTDPGRETAKAFVEAAREAFDLRESRSAREPRVRIYRMRRRA